MRLHRATFVPLRNNVPFAMDAAVAYNRSPSMERSLRNRLTYGPMMLAALGLLLWLDDEIQRRPRAWYEDRYSAEGIRGGVGGVGLLILLAIILPIAVRELATLFTAERVRPYRFIASVGSGALIVHAFLTQFPP